MAADLPEGFVLDRQQGAPKDTGLPKGFVLDKSPGGKSAQPTARIGLETQTLYDMARTPQERKRALEHTYGAGSVKEDAKGLYVEHEGKRLKPAESAFEGAGPMAARIFAEAAPAIGAGVGAAVGAVAGPGVALIGAGLGGAGGQAFNDTLLGIAGIHDRSLGQEVAGLGESGAWSAGGEGAGRIIGKGIGAAMHAGGAIRSGVRWMYGVDQAELARAKELADAGVHVPPESYSQHPGMVSIVRKWAQRFGYDPVADTAKPYYQSKAGDVLKHLGIGDEQIGKITEPRAAVSYEETGEALIKKAQSKLVEDDAKLDAAVASMRSSMALKKTEAVISHAQQINDLAKASADARASAQALIDHSWKQIDSTQDRMWKAANLGTEPGNLAREYSQRIWSLRKAVARRANTFYGAADSMGAGAGTIDVSPVKKTAEAFRDQLPEDLQKAYPGLTAMIADMSSGKMTFGEARAMRSVLREIADFENLTPNFKNGIFKKLSGELNAAIHAPANAPKIKQAVSLLDHADDFYAKNMARFKDAQVRNLTAQVKAGLPPDPEEIASKVLRGGNTERAAELKRIVNPKIWDATVAADIKDMMKNSQSLVPGMVDAKQFSSLVSDRLRKGTLELYPKAERELLIDTARKMQALNGKLDVAALPNDSFKTFLERANQAADDVKKMAKINPVKSLEEALKQQEREFAAQRSQLSEQRAADQLGFLTKPSALASESAKRIVRDPDLLRAALLRFDADGPEIGMLRQTAALDMLTMGLDKGGNLMDRLTAEGMTPEVQKRLFPNGLDADVRKLAEHMEMLFPKGSDAFAALSGGAMVLHPHRVVPDAIKGPAVLHALWRVPVGTAMGAIAHVVTSPTLIKWLSNGIAATPAEREAVREAILGLADAGGDVGAITSAYVGQIAASPNDPKSVDATGGPNNWRKTYQQQYGRSP